MYRYLIGYFSGYQPVTGPIPLSGKHSYNTSRQSDIAPTHMSKPSQYMTPINSMTTSSHNPMTSLSQNQNNQSRHMPMPPINRNSMGLSDQNHASSSDRLSTSSPYSTFSNSSPVKQKIISTQTNLSSSSSSHPSTERLNRCKNKLPSFNEGFFRCNYEHQSALSRNEIYFKSNQTFLESRNEVYCKSKFEHQSSTSRNEVYAKETSENQTLPSHNQHYHRESSDQQTSSMSRKDVHYKNNFEHQITCHDRQYTVPERFDEDPKRSYNPYSNVSNLNEQFPSKVNDKTPYPIRESFDLTSSKNKIKTSNKHCELQNSSSNSSHCHNTKNEDGIFCNNKLSTFKPTPKTDNRVVDDLSSNKDKPHITRSQPTLSFDTAQQTVSSGSTGMENFFGL